MFNSFHEEDITLSKPRREQSYKPDSQHFSEREEINFSHASSRRHRHDSNSNFSKDLNSQCSDSFMFLRGRVDSQDKLNANSFPHMNASLDPKTTNLTLNESNQIVCPQSVLNRLDVNSLCKSQNNPKHKLSDMLSSGKELYKTKHEDKETRNVANKKDLPRLGKRSHNRTSIFQNQIREPDMKRHIDFLNSSNNNLMFNNNGIIRKTELTRIVSLLGDRSRNSGNKQNFCNSIQQGQKEEELLNDERPNIRSFGKLWSGLDSLQNHPEQQPSIGLNSMQVFEKDGIKIEDSQLKFKRNLFSNKFSDDSKQSLVSDVECFNELSQRNSRHLKYPFTKGSKGFISKGNLNENYSEDGGLRNVPLRKHIPEAAEESEISRPSKNAKVSDGESMYISELNDNNSKDRLLLKVLMENSKKKVNINTLNTNFNTVNNNNNNLNYIANPARNGKDLSSNESQFITYLNNIKNYYVDPLSKSIFLKIGAEEEVAEEEKEKKESPNSQSSQLVPLTRFMNRGILQMGGEGQDTIDQGNLNILGGVLLLEILRFLDLIYWKGC